MAKFLGKHTSFYVQIVSLTYSVLSSTLSLIWKAHPKPPLKICQVLINRTPLRTQHYLRLREDLILALKELMICLGLVDLEGRILVNDVTSGKTRCLNRRQMLRTQMSEVCFLAFMPLLMLFPLPGMPAPSFRNFTYSLKSGQHHLL